MQILQVFGSNGKNYKIESLKYGTKIGMLLLMENGEWHTCNGNEKITCPTEYDCTGQVKLKPTYHLNIQ